MKCIYLEIYLSENVYYNYVTGNVDYNETHLTLTFPRGTTGGVKIPFSVPIIDDNIAEHQESIRIDVSTSGDGIGIYSMTSHFAFIDINDNDREY